MTTIVIDTAAGREEGREALAAAAIASLELDIQLVIVGDEGVITPALQRLAHDAERLRVVHADTPARTIQTLAGHANSATTDRYMHLAPRTLNSAIELLDPAQADERCDRLVDALA